ncbi:RecX family transcriptional regulator [Melghirimyces algeriensis]|uniref:Regulatory protein RecX n=1 Tax=Melghirimyces algeriensis TaxID=910412 RepID=A0A521C8U8_9BACL|nr:RecX family transcriptional regulator [Melghirimyces algeriensis]SMO55813.1 regulatory protein [Melghirimyces algeriensis]
MQEPGEITRIEKQKSGAPRYNIYINGNYRFAVHEDVLVRFALSKGMQVDAGEVEHILKEEERNKVRQSALRYLSFRPRTVYEMKQHLAGKGYETTFVDETVTEMIHQRYLDDRRFAEAWVEERRRRKGFGTRMLKQELEKKGVSSKIVDEVLDRLNEDEERELALEMAERRYRRLAGESWPKVERRLGQYLLRRGFVSSLVYELLREFQRRHKEGEG